MRGILLKISMYSIKQLDDDTFPLGRFQTADKIKLKSSLQMEIISKIMLYIEDLIILSESFRIGISYYKLLDTSDENKKDVGKIIQDFFNNVNSFSDEDFFRIMAYVNPEKLNLSENEKQIVGKNIQNIVNELRRIFNRIGDFGKTNHPIFRRFKHAGCPIVFGAPVDFNGSFFSSNFDSYSMISIGADPMNDVIPIPFSNEVLEGYHILIHGIQLVLKDMLTNHIACIERNIQGLIPIESYSPKDFPKENKPTYEKIINDFYKTHPPNIEELKHLHVNAEIKKNDLTWYLNLPQFLEECKKIKEENTDW